MRLTFICWLSLWIALSMQVSAQDLQQNIRVHEPVMIKQDSTYYLFATGRGIAVLSSKDMKNWQQHAPVFQEAPHGPLRQSRRSKTIYGRRISAIIRANITFIIPSPLLAKTPPPLDWPPI